MAPTAEARRAELREWSENAEKHAPGGPGEDRPPMRGVFGARAWRIGRVAGIDLGLDHSWLLIFALITFSLSRQLGGAHESFGAAQVWLGALFGSVAFFASILLHELGHSLTALRLGVRVRSITLFLFGGVAQLAEEPHRPGDEIVIAIAGPIVSALLGVAFLELGALAGPDNVSGAVFVWLGTVNLVLAVFNLVPGFPLDGGRILRGIVWALTGSFERATRAAANAGAVFAVSLMAVGVLLALTQGALLGGLWLVFIGWFLLQASRAAVGSMVLERLLSQVSVGDVMVGVDAAQAAPELSVAEAFADAVLRHGLRTLYVVDSGRRLLGLVTLRELAAVPQEQRESTPLARVMTPSEQLRAMSPRDTGWSALQRMGEKNLNQLPVVEDGRLLGSVTRERLFNVLHAAMLVEAESGLSR